MLAASLNRFNKVGFVGTTTETLLQRGVEIYQNESGNPSTISFALAVG
jgi:hypothetical protein